MRILQLPLREHPELQNTKFLNFFLWVGIFSYLDPDLDSQSGAGSRGPIESGSNLSKTLGYPVNSAVICNKFYGILMITYGIVL
jgi:hypothetical protein